MSEFSRRTLLSTVAAASAGALLPDTLLAQNQPAQAARFGYDDVIRRARELAAAPFDPVPPRLPEELEKVDFDAWRDIRFRPDKALLAATRRAVPAAIFMLGHLFKRPVTVNTIRDGIATPIPFAANLFDFGRTKLDKPLPVNSGFAGFRLHYPLNDPRIFDEVIAFLGASYFRFLGRGQRYGMSARGLSVGAGTPNEEFPFFREFWVEAPGPNADHATIYGAARRRDRDRRLPLRTLSRAGIGPRRSGQLSSRDAAGAKIGFAPLTSMFFIGKNDHRFHDDFRPELHDSDGLLVNSGTGEWLWRPLRNPAQMEDLGVSRPQHPRLRPDPARPQFRPLSGPRARLPDAPELLGRAARRLGRGPGRTCRAANSRRDQRQHRRLMGAEGSARARQGSDLRLIASRRASILRGSRQMRGRSTHFRQVPTRSARPSRAKRMRGASSSISPAAISPISSMTRAWSKSCLQPVRDVSCALRSFPTS